MIQEISSEDFENFTRDASKVEFLREYIPKGVIVFKDSAINHFYVHSSCYDLRIDNLDDFESFVKNPKKYDRPAKPMIVQSIFFGQNPYKERFPEESYRLIGELSKATDIPLIVEGNLQRDSLALVDLFISQQDNPKEFRIKQFMSLVALLGETIIEKFPGHCCWEMTLSARDRVTWEPEIYYDGNWLAIGARLYESMFDKEDEAPLQATFDLIDTIINTILQKNK